MPAQGKGTAEAAAPLRDAQIGKVFHNMRAALRQPREAIARRLATTPATIENLESGAVLALPHWPETARIVRSYCELLKLDPEPILWRIQQLLRGGSEEARLQQIVRGGGNEVAPTRSPSPRPPALPRAPAGAGEIVPRRRGGGVRTVLLLGALPVAAAALAYLAVLAPAAVYRAISLLPASVAGPARGGLDALVVYSAPRRDGLKWVDVGDPQLRKGNKLPTKAR